MKNKIAEIIRKIGGEVETDCIVLLPNEVDEAANEIAALYKQAFLDMLPKLENMTDVSIPFYNDSPNRDFVRKSIRNNLILEIRKKLLEE